MPARHDSPPPDEPRWAKTIGGILAVSGFGDFLDNYGAAESAHDPIVEALAILAAAKPGQALRPAQVGPGRGRAGPGPDTLLGRRTRHWGERAASGPSGPSSIATRTRPSRRVPRRSG